MDGEREIFSALLRGVLVFGEIIWTFPLNGFLQEVESQCYTSNQSGLKVADCSARNLRSVRHTLNHDIRLLRFNDNQLTSLTDGQFMAYDLLIELYLGQNLIEGVGSGVFQGLSRLLLSGSRREIGWVPSQVTRSTSWNL